MYSTLAAGAPSRGLGLLLRLLAAAALYALLAELSFALQPPSAGLAVVWLPTGFMLACLLRAPTREWPALLAAAFVAAAVPRIASGSDAWLALEFATLNVVEVALAAGLTRTRIGGRIGPEQLKDVLAATLVAGASSIALTAFLAAFAVPGTVPPAQIFELWRAWSLSSLIGMLLLTPLVLGWRNDWLQQLRRGLALRKLIPAAAVVAVACLVLWRGDVRSPLPFLLAFPALLWLAAAAGTSAAAAGTLLVAMAVTLKFAAGEGPLQHLGAAPAARALWLQVYLAVLAGTVTLVARWTQERQLALHAAHAAEARLSGVIASAMDAIVACDAELRITLFNSAAEKVFGWTRTEVVGKNIDVLLPRRFRDSHRERMLEYGAAGVTSRSMGALGVVQAMRRNGEEFPAEVTISRVEADGERLYTAILRDVSRRLKDEAELQELNAHLEQRVQERTARLEAANRELEAFSYSVSHDLRAPLRAISGHCGLLAESDANALSVEGAAHLDAVRRNALHMAQLIEDLLQFSRCGRKELLETNVDLGELAASAVERLRPAYPGARIALGALPRARGDQALLAQVFANLLDNACKFSSRCDDPRVEVGCAETAAGRAVYVKDNGAGFDMRYAERLFGVFERLHSADEFEGTGVGLALCRRILERHGGTIWAESAPGRGATFYFALRWNDRA